MVALNPFKITLLQLLVVVACTHTHTQAFAKDYPFIQLMAKRARVQFPPRLFCRAVSVFFRTAPCRTACSKVHHLSTVCMRPFHLHLCWEHVGSGVVAFDKSFPLTFTCAARVCYAALRFGVLVV